MATSAQVITAVREAQANGWKVASTGFGYRITSPASEIELPTPDYVTERMWPGQTYHALFQLVINVSGDRVTFAQTRVSYGPWVGVQESTVSLTKAIEFLRTDHITG